MALKPNAYALAFAAVFCLTVLATLYIEENWVVDIANSLARPLSGSPTGGGIRERLQDSSVDATKTPACASLFVASGTVYVYSLYLIALHRLGTPHTRNAEYMLVPL